MKVIDPIVYQRFKVLIHAHILNPLWLSSAKRREKRGEGISKVVTEYLKQNYLSSADGILPTEPVRNDDEKIFSIWFQGEENAPQLVKSCFDSIRKHCKEELVVLDSNTIFDYITLPETIVNRFKAGEIQYWHFADICRVELLHKYGGYWIDSTCFVTGPIPQYIKDEDFFMFMAGPRAHSKYSFVQNCFIRARKGSYLLEAWRAIILAYWMKEDLRIDYFQHQLMFKVLVENNKKAADLFDAMPQVDQYPTHRFWYREGDRPYDAKEVEEVTKEGFFFQKTSYREADDSAPGSYREWMVNASNAACK